ncbi:phosphatase PAP2 family protein [Sedimentitalea nanhaiensis]|nr:phosphatase PAP2 family protein [Sedimentitalea nanhaiensis]
MRAWPDWCGQVVLNNEILSRLTYSFDPVEGAAIVHLLDFRNPEQIAVVPLARLIAPEAEDFAIQARIVNDYADLRPDRMAEVTDQAAGTLGYFARLMPLDMGRMPLTRHVLGLAQDCALHVAQHCKHLLACRRPDALSSQIQPMIPTPGHSTLPSGHATEAFAIAGALQRLVPLEFKTEDLDAKLIHMAARIAVNRTVAGVHFPADSFAGAVLGFAVADVIARRAGDPGDIFAVRFDGRGIRHADFYASRVWKDAQRQDFTTDDGVEITRFLPDSIATDTSGILRWLWTEARQEWSR